MPAMEDHDHRPGLGGAAAGLGSTNTTSHSTTTTTTTTFAESQMKKYGWSKGTGLGKHRDGISKAISVGFKDDTTGIGAKDGEWSFAWWDHVFNKTSAGISVQRNLDGEGNLHVEVQQKQEEEDRAAKRLLYGSFVKSTGIVVEDKKDWSRKVDDRELLDACEGRTARKGARASQPGKLHRAAERVSTIVTTKRKRDDDDGDGDGDATEEGAPTQAKVEKRARKEARRLRREAKARRRALRAAATTASSSPQPSPSPTSVSTTEVKEVKEVVEEVVHVRKVKKASKKSRKDPTAA
ncbi:G patch domain-containing protein 4 [Thoreauomyces humboldtii]|nr:G patch domain-containing protein 4 [Thoreauomyces humboldtii]